jgi:hypothetical protein
MLAPPHGVMLFDSEEYKIPLDWAFSIGDAIVFVRFSIISFDLFRKK